MLYFNDCFLNMYSWSSIGGSCTSKTLRFMPLLRSSMPSGDELEGDGAFLRVINLFDVEYSMRFNPIQLRYLPTLQDTILYSEKLVNAHIESSDFHDVRYLGLLAKHGSHLLAAALWFVMNYNKMPYDVDAKILVPEYTEDPQTHAKTLTGRVFDNEGNAAEPAYWKGEFSDMPHALALLNQDFSTLFDVLSTRDDLSALLRTASEMYRWKDMSDLDFFHSLLFSLVAELSTPEFFWVFSGDDFTVSRSPDVKDYLLLVTPNHQSYFRLLSAFLGCDADRKEPDSLLLLENDRFDVINNAIHNSFYMFYGVGQTRDDYLAYHYRTIVNDTDRIIKSLFRPKDIHIMIK